MLPKCLILIWRLGELTVSVLGAAATPSAADSASILVAEFPSYAAFEIATSPEPAQIPSAITIAENTSDRAHAAIVAPNAADVSLQMVPDQAVSIGEKISFRVTTRKPGYLLLVDIDPAGKMTQIFPSPEMVVQSRDAATNFIRPGETLAIPNPAAQQRGFEYVITPPAGDAAVVAILSDRRVQLLDLPDDAQQPRSGAETIDYLMAWTGALRVPDTDSGKLRPSNWSFDVRPYSVRP
jgi:Domain of unknown function (DUF4384)